MKIRHWVGLLGVVAMLAPSVVVAEDAPVPLPRRTDRLPAGAEVANSPAAPANAQQVDTATPAAEAAAAIAAPPQPVTLAAKITDGGATIADGVTWRVFEARTDASGELPLAAKSNEATAHIELPPGNYVVHVAYGRAQTTDTINVVEGNNDKSLTLDAGAMRLNAAVSGDIPIPINLLRFDIFTAGSDAERVVVAENLSPNDVVALNAGTYHIVSHFGDVNAVVRADLRVEPGQLTEATLYHQASQVSFKLVSEPGGEAIADIDWSVKDQSGQSLFTTTGAFPSTVLGKGDYVVTAKRGDQVYTRPFEVVAGAGEEIEVLTKASLAPAPQ